MNAAKLANEQRYQDILAGYNNQYTALTQQQAAANQALLSGYDERYAKAMASLENLGVTNLADIAANYTKQRGAASQGLISRGLGNTTVTDAVRRGLTRDETRATTAAKESTAATKSQYEQSLSADKLAALKAAQNEQLALQQALKNQVLQFMERKTDAYPDVGLYTQLAQMQSQAPRQAGPLTTTTYGGGGRVTPRAWAVQPMGGGGLDMYPGGAAGRAADAAKMGGGYGAALTGGGGGIGGMANAGPVGFVAPGSYGGGNAGNAGMNWSPGGGSVSPVYPSYSNGPPSGSAGGGGFDAGQFAGIMGQYTQAIQQAVGGGRTPTTFGGGGAGANWSQGAWGNADPSALLSGAQGAMGGQYLQSLGNLGSYGSNNFGGGGGGSNWSARAFAPNTTAGLPALGSLPGSSNFNDMLSQYGASTGGSIAGAGLGSLGSLMRQFGFNQSSLFNPITAEGMFPQQTPAQQTPTQPTQTRGNQWYDAPGGLYEWGTEPGRYYSRVPYYGLYGGNQQVGWEYVPSNFTAPKGTRQIEIFN